MRADNAGSQGGATYKTRPTDDSTHHKPMQKRTETRGLSAAHDGDDGGEDGDDGDGDAHDGDDDWWR